MALSDSRIDSLMVGQDQSIDTVVVKGKTALVLCGGGSRGAVEVGLYRALVELGIKIDLIIGCSVGAINGVFIGAGAPPDELAALWKAIRKKHLFGYNHKFFFTPFSSDGLLKNTRIHKLFIERLPVHRFEDLETPLIINGTNLQTGEPVYFETGDLVLPLLASCALPGLLPPMNIDGCQIIDGGFSNNVPLDAAIARGADTVICMLCQCCSENPYPVQGWMKMIIASLSIAMHRKYQADLLHFSNRARLVIMEPHTELEAGMDVGLLDFSHTEELIELGYQHAMKNLQNPENKVCCHTGIGNK